VISTYHTQREKCLKAEDLFEELESKLDSALASFQQANLILKFPKPVKPQLVQGSQRDSRDGPGIDRVESMMVQKGKIGCELENVEQPR
jgi:hypothetical protein